MLGCVAAWVAGSVILAGDGTVLSAIAILTFLEDNLVTNQAVFQEDLDEALL